MSRFEDEDAAVPYDPDGDPGSDPAGDPPALGVLRRHEARLLGIDGVEGIGLGLDAAGGDAVVLYLRDAGAGERVPSTIEGLPVLTEVTGPIEAY